MVGVFDVRVFFEDEYTFMQPFETFFECIPLRFTWRCLLEVLSAEGCYEVVFSGFVEFDKMAPPSCIG